MQVKTPGSLDDPGTVWDIGKRESRDTAERLEVAPLAVGVGLSAGYLDMGIRILW